MLVRAAVSFLAGALVVVSASGCKHATCADYHEPGCWTPPPQPDGGGDAGSDAEPSAADAGAAPADGATQDASDDEAADGADLDASAPSDATSSDASDGD